MTMEKLDIEIFQAIIAYNNIQLAANELHMAPTTAGARLKKLENELGFKLFERRKGIKYAILTKKGEEFIPISNQMLSLFKTAEELKNSKTKKSLTIATVDSFYDYNFDSFYNTLIGKYSLDIKRFPSDMIYQMVTNKKADIGFALYPANYKNVKVEKLFEDELAVIINKDSKYNNLINPSDLNSEEEYLVADENNMYVGGGPDVYLWHQKYFPVNHKPKIRVNNISMAFPFLYQKDFWMLVPELTALELQKKYPIKILKLKDAPKRICYLLTNNMIQKDIDDFIILLKEYIQKIGE